MRDFTTEFRNFEVLDDFFILEEVESDGDLTVVLGKSETQITLHFRTGYRPGVVIGHPSHALAKCIMEELSVQLSRQGATGLSIQRLSFKDRDIQYTPASVRARSYVSQARYQIRSMGPYPYWVRNEMNAGRINVTHSHEANSTEPFYVVFTVQSGSATIEAKLGDQIERTPDGSLVVLRTLSEVRQTGDQYARASVSIRPMG